VLFDLFVHQKSGKDIELSINVVLFTVKKFMVSENNIQLAVKRQLNGYYHFVWDAEDCLKCLQLYAPDSLVNRLSQQVLVYLKVRKLLGFRHL
jgi:hypothetical protein